MDVRPEHRTPHAMRFHLYITFCEGKAVGTEMRSIVLEVWVGGED